MHPFDLEFLWQLCVDLLVDGSAVLVGDCQLALLELFGQVEAIDREREFGKQLREVAFGGQVVGILILRQNDIWLQPNRVRLLEPEEWYGAANLHERGDLRLKVKLEIVDVNNLLYFDEIGDVSVLIDASFEVPRSGKAPGSTRNQDERAVLCIAPEIELAYIAVDDGHDPLLLHKASVELLDQVVVPQEVRFEGRVLAEDLFREAMDLQALEN